MHKNKKYVSGTKMFSKKMMSLSMHLQYEQHSHKTSYGNVIFICLQYYSQLISSWSRKANLQQFAEQIGNKKKNLVLACLKISISSFSQLRPIYIFFSELQTSSAKSNINYVPVVYAIVKFLMASGIVEILTI